MLEKKYKAKENSKLRDFIFASDEKYADHDAHVRRTFKEEAFSHPRGHGEISLALASLLGQIPHPLRV